MLQEYWYSHVSIQDVRAALTFHQVTRYSVSTLGWATFCTNNDTPMSHFAAGLQHLRASVM